MKTILISGFEPFDGYSVNPSAEIIKAFKGKSIPDAKVISIVLPLDYNSALEKFRILLDEHEPDFILSLGQSNRPSITIERMGINVLNTDREDNYGNKPGSDIIDKRLDAAYFSNIDPHPLVDILRENDIPATISYHAGTYGCNWLFFNVMSWITKGEIDAMATFIHVPPLPQQAIEKNNYSLATMALEMQVRAIELVLDALLHSTI
ncbi:pyroglutamyl-peptidase I [Candidatus Thorarchaeota archaeon]|nr:MAG: pyroglutamyl-peptidase I [Candidatus Thorarchaeota archaeon]